MKFKFAHELKRGNVIQLEHMRLTVAEIAIGIEKIALRLVGNVHGVSIREVSSDMEILVFGSVQLSDADEVTHDVKNAD